MQKQENVGRKICYAIFLCFKVEISRNVDDDDDDSEPFAVTLQAVIHEEVKHGVGVDGDQPDGEGEDVVQVVKGKEVPRWLVPDKD